MATTLLEYFNELRDQNPFSWVKDSEITVVEAGHAEMTLQTNDTEYCNFRGDLHGAVCIGLADSVLYLIYHGVLLKKTTLIWYNIV